MEGDQVNVYAVVAYSMAFVLSILIAAFILVSAIDLDLINLIKIISVMCWAAIAQLVLQQLRKGQAQ